MGMKRVDDPDRRETPKRPVFTSPKPKAKPVVIDESPDGFAKEVSQLFSGRIVTPST